MLWKILSAITALFLGAGLFFAYKNQGQIKEERAMEERAKNYLKDTLAAQKDAATQTDLKTKALAESTKVRDDTRVEITKAQADIKTKEDELAALKTKLAEEQKKLAEIQDQIKKAGDIKTLMAEVKNLTEEVKQGEAKIANWQQEQALTEEKITKAQAQVAAARELDSRQRRGQMEPGFTGRISQTYPEFGFVVLNKGNLGGVHANALLDVKRGKEVVAKLRVRDVEQSGAIADLVPGSLSADGGLQSGDLVVPAPLPKAPAETTTPAPAAAAPGAAPDAAGKPMAAPIMGGDPFGAAPAPAPAAAPTPAPAGADPFGAAPMATPPAGGAAKGTPEKPSTADPFAK